MSRLAERKCVSLENGAQPLKGKQLEELLNELNHDWDVVDEHHLEKEYHFKNFRDALNFTVKVGELAEELNHHPEITLTWGKVILRIWTHKINGLAECDFILAAKADQLYSH